MKRDRRGRIIGYNWWRELVVSSWASAWQAWSQERDYEAIGYDTEEQAYSEEHPQPTLKEYMLGLKFKE